MIYIIINRNWYSLLLPVEGHDRSDYQKCNHRYKTIDFTFFSKKGLCNIGLTAKSTIFACNNKQYI